MMDLIVCSDSENDDSLDFLPTYQAGPQWTTRHQRQTIIDHDDEATKGVDSYKVAAFGGWNDLPPSVGYAIFATLPPGDLFAVSNACSSWRRAARDPRLWPTMVVVQIGPQATESYCSEAFKYASTITEAIISLRESEDSSASINNRNDNKDSDKVTLTFNNWTRVDTEVVGSPRLCAAAVAPLAKFCKRLRTLNLSFCSNADIGILGYFKNCKHLRSVTITGVDDDQEAKLTAWLLASFPELKKLEIGALSDKGFKLLAENRSNQLLSLHFSPRYMTHSGLAQLEKFKHLRALNLCYPPIKVLPAYRHALKSLRFLIVLRLTLEGDATPWFLGSTTEENHPYLTHIHVTAHSISDHFSESLETPHLQHLGIESISSRAPFTDTGLSRVYACCPLLKFLFLSGLPKITDKCLHWLSRGMLPKLSRMYLFDMPGLSYDALEMASLVREDLDIVCESVHRVLFSSLAEHRRILSTKLMHEAWFEPNMKKLIRISNAARKMTQNLTNLCSKSQQEMKGKRRRSVSSKRRQSAVQK